MTYVLIYSLYVTLYVKNPAMVFVQNETTCEQLKIEIAKSYEHAEAKCLKLKF